MPLVDDLTIEERYWFSLLNLVEESSISIGVAKMDRAKIAALIDPNRSRFHAVGCLVPVLMGAYIGWSLNWQIGLIAFVVLSLASAAVTQFLDGNWIRRTILFHTDSSWFDRLYRAEAIRIKVAATGKTYGVSDLQWQDVVAVVLVDSGRA